MAYASWMQRAGGYLIDILTAFIPAFIAGLYYESTVDAAGRPSTAGRVVDIIGIVVGLAILIYNRWIQGGRTGQSWGRRVMNIRLDGEASGQPIGGGRAFLRDLGHLLDSAALFIGWLLPLWDGKRQTFGDKIMNTVVVRAA